MNILHPLVFLYACLICCSFNASAVVLNTLNGVDYEWLELTETAGMSRVQVEYQLNDINSPLYGYQYASRSLIEALFLSYTSWDGLNGWHSADSTVNGILAHQNDFGITRTNIGTGTALYFTTIDEGISAEIDGSIDTKGYYGSAGECVGAGPTDDTCVSDMTTFFDLLGNPTMSLQSQWAGWSATLEPGVTVSTQVDASIGSYLVRITSPIPTPPAIWLFGSGLLGLISMARRNHLIKMKS